MYSETFGALRQSGEIKYLISSCLNHTLVIKEINGLVRNRIIRTSSYDELKQN